MAKEFIEFETTSLLALLGKKDNKLNWEKMGTSKKEIILTDTKLSLIDEETGLISYILPIKNKNKAEEFITQLVELGITGTIIDEEKAKKVKEEKIKAKKEKLK